MDTEFEITDQTEEVEVEIDQPEDSEEVEETDPKEAELAAKLAELEAKEAKIAEWEKKVNARSTELGAIAKQLEQTKAPATSESKYDDETKQQLKELFQETFGIDPSVLTDTIKTTQQTLAQQREAIFFEAVKDEGVSGEELYAALMDIGIDPEKADPATLSKAVARLTPALKTVDPEVIAKKAVEEYVASLGKKGVKPEEVVEVKKGRGSAAGAHRSVEDIMNDKSLDWHQRQELIDKITGMDSQD